MVTPPAAICILKVIQIMNNSVGDSEKTINNSGQSGNIAGRDLHISNITNINKNDNSKHTNSAIEEVLSGIYSITQDEKLCYQKPDSQPYSIEDKIDYNEISMFKNNIESFMDGYTTVRTLIRAGLENDLSFRKKIINYISTKLMMINENYDNESNSSKINLLAESIQKQLIGWNAKLDGDELTAVIYVIFYVFAECKIFKKPLPQGINNDIK